MKYRQNLKILGNSIFSYNTRVAKIGKKYVKPLGWWSKTTSKHINYAAGILGKKVKK